MKSDIISRMGAYVFNNQIFDGWLNKKAEEILSKVNRETITTEEMIVLILKAQTNHFYHMDQETKEDMTSLRLDVSALKMHMKEEFNQVKNEFASVKSDIKEESRKNDTRLMWSAGITVTMFLGLYLKLFLG